MTGWMYDAAVSGPRLRMFLRGCEAMVYLDDFSCCVCCSSRSWSSRALVQFRARTLWRAKVQCLFWLLWMVAVTR